MNASRSMAVSKPARTFQDLLVWQSESLDEKVGHAHPETRNDHCTRQQECRKDEPHGYIAEARERLGGSKRAGEGQQGHGQQYAHSHRHRLGHQGDDDGGETLSRCACG